MTDLITLLATATDDRLDRFADMACLHVCEITSRKKTLIILARENHLPAIIEAAIGAAVTLQRVHEPGRAETYETLHQGPMEGWGNHVKV